MKKILATGLVALAFSLGGCATTPTANLTPLEIQQIQSRSFEADYNTTFRSVVSVFQDLGYTIKSADIATGFITAESAAKSDAATQFWLGLAKVDQTAVTGFVEAIGNKTTVRLNFVNRVETSTGSGQQNKNETPIYDSEPYRVAFEKIENAIFVRKATQ
jgi:hypothetical protein